MKSTDDTPEGVVRLQPGVWEARPESAGHLRKCMAEVRRQDAVRSVVLDLTTESKAASGRSFELGLTGVPTPLIAAVSGFVRGWRAEAAFRSHLCFSDEDATFDEHPFRSKRANPGEQTRILTAQEMIHHGHLNRPLCEGNALQVAREAAARISLMAPLAITACLEAVSVSAFSDIDEGLEIEVEICARLFETEDMRLGTKAFLCKTNPKFRGT